MGETVEIVKGIEVGSQEPGGPGGAKGDKGCEPDGYIGAVPGGYNTPPGRRDG